MFALHDRSTRLCDGVSRRELLRIGGLSTLGLSLPALLAGKASAGPLTTGSDVTFGRAKNVMFLWLQGGPPQHETFDPKPDAPAEIRGEFQPIATNVPGIQFSELLPRISTMADKLAIVRSLCTHTDLHDASGYWILTGYKYTGRESRQISPTDWPYLGSIIKMLKPSTTLPAYTSVWLPDMMRLNDNVTPAGQTSGFLSRHWEPERLVCDPSSAEFKVEGLTLPPEVPPLRLSAREELRGQIERHFAAVERGPTVDVFDRHAQEAYGLLTTGRARTAFDLHREPEALRQRYGRNKWGQCLLLGRRLIEAGARLVHVNWPREGGDEAVNNPMWDTHAQNADRLQDVLCPVFDVGFTALLEDLEQRGLLSETLVVAIGEFGRTPKINSQGGRDHWGHVFSFALAGAGISGGQVYGSSDKQGAYPRDGRMEPQELTATILHLLGIGHQALFQDAAGRPFHATTGEPIAALLGDQPATAERTPAGGNVALVPPYTRDHLLNFGFEDETPLFIAGKKKRLKGWQANPVIESVIESPAGVETQSSFDFGVRLLTDAGVPRTGRRHVVMGYGVAGAMGGSIPEGSTLILTQEVRNPRAGTYNVTVRMCGGGTAEDFREFLKHFRCRLVLFGYNELTKNPLKGGREFESVVFQPVFAETAQAYQDVKLSRKLRSQEAGASEIEMGVGLSVLVERISSGPLTIPPGRLAFIRIDDVEIQFIPRPRNDDVKV